MAKKHNKALLAVGLVAAGVGIYLLTRKPSTTTTTTPTPYPYPYPVGTNTASGSGSTLSTLLSLGLSAAKGLFGSSSSPAFAPVGLASTDTSYTSPAAGINYINPSAPNIFLPPASSDPTAGDFSGAFSGDSGGIIPTQDIFV